MRVLVDHESGQTGDAPDLAAAYAAPRHPWLRVNMVSTLDGAATGSDRRSGSINNAADKRVYDLLRSQSDAILVGAGTARAEGYGLTDLPTVVVTRTGSVPLNLLSGPPGAVLLATMATAPGIAEARTLLAPEDVLVLGEDSVDLAELRSRLLARGLAQVLCEGGPHLLADLLAAGVVDELCLTLVPQVVGGDALRIAQGDWLEADLRLRLLLEHDGTLLGRWFT